jgi:hypothetical protein
MELIVEASAALAGGATDPSVCKAFTVELEALRFLAIACRANLWLLNNLYIKQTAIGVSMWSLSKYAVRLFG